MKFFIFTTILWLLYPLVQVNAQEKNKISFISDFEGGNLGPIDELSEDHYRLHLHGESDWQQRNRQVSWYYFLLQGAQNRDLTLELTDLIGEYNFKPGAHAITRYTRPVFSYDQTHWQHFSDDQVSWNDSQKELILQVRPTQNHIWIAHQPPYTTANLTQLIDHLDEIPYCMIDTIGRTPQNRPLLLISVGKKSGHNQKVVWLMARQHSWESGTSWVMESILNYLTAEGSEHTWSDRFIFKIFPMGDPDGVARGGVRFNQYGHDLNRNWDLVMPKEMPEIFYQKKAISEWIAEGNKIDFFLTLHNTEANDYLQGPDLASGHLVWRYMQEQSSFTAPEGLRPIKDSIDPGRMTVYENLWSEFGVAAYLMELKVEKVSKLNRSRNVRDWSELGPALIRSITSALDSQ